MNVHELIELAVTNKASDLHLNVTSPPTLRIYGNLVPIQGIPLLTAKDIQEAFEEVATAEKRRDFAASHDIDFYYSIAGLARCRINVMQQRNTLSMSVRIIPFKIPTIEDLNLPPVIRDLILKPTGLILITGPTGSGKSSTIAAMINYLNENLERNIITIEDPIEYVHTNNKCLISQRNLGEDTASFDNALIHALRHDPDVIVVGEMREMTTMITAIRAAETGHLVLGTLHTSDASQTVNRIIDMFPASQHDQVRSELAQILTAVVCQTLIPRADGQGRVPACEIMIVNNAVRNTIREGRIHQLYSLIQVSSKEGMQTLNQALSALISSGTISEDQAFVISNMLEELKTMRHSYHPT
ncbi:MAG: type IV pilus twitching motility protein PilT [Chloroflexi bacterium]|jgi:twitching motility protein PilT|nr:type IV pilus twitching motility protein PilT [Chloroflexota bacterium]